MQQTTQAQAHAARLASRTLASTSLADRNRGLAAMAEALQTDKARILAANEADLARSQEEGLSAPLIKRLRFDEAKLRDVLAGLTSLRSLPDPVGHTQLARELSPGLTLYRVSCPIGVVGVIFESRPDALVQIASLCLKSGNAVLLKGGREAKETNRALYEALVHGTRTAGLPEGWIGLLESREEVSDMLRMDEDIDLVIPRGSNDFVRYIMDHSRIPVMGHADGICHVYIDQACDVDMAVRVAVDAKAQYVAVCNACETLLVHEAAASRVLTELKRAMDAAHVRLLGCEKTRAVIPVAPATEADWDTEYLDYVLSIRVVPSLEAAISHINTHGSGHTDAIVTQDAQAAAAFLNGVDSAGVYWNCSTRFADGFRYGFGAEVGIATGKVHARGPMGLEGLTIYKYKLLGNGQTVADVAEGREVYTHRDQDEDCPL